MLLTFSKNRLYLGGKPFDLACGDIHYFRIYPGGLRRRLEWMKAFGLTAVQTYVPWNLHEPEKGRFVFDGLCDLEGFLSLCAELDLKVLLRPSPYICSEWDFGGLPYWLHQDGSTPRTSDPRFLSHVAAYYDVLCPRFLPYLSTRGGPIIAVAVENEYGSFGNDKAYLQALADMLSERGVDVPLYTTDGHETTDLSYGMLNGVWAGVNYRIESRAAIDSLRRFQKDKPPLVGEYWSGRAIHWGEPYEHRVVSDVAEAYREALEQGGLVSFYMFAGGTSFGFLNGANFGLSFSTPKGMPPHYIPHTTTYDEDALLNEQGLPTKKYFACRKVLCDFLGKSEPPLPTDTVKTQVLPPIPLTCVGSLWDALDEDRAVESQTPLSFEQMGQDYGYLLYRTELVGCGVPLKLKISDLRDRADVYVDRVYRGTLMRDRDPDFVEFYAPKGKKVVIELLCENMGRINYGPKLFEQKGICGNVTVTARHTVHLFGWKQIPLPFREMPRPKGTSTPMRGPVLLRGEFSARAGEDTFLDMRNFGKGVVFVNDFCLGRYWSIGPQYTLYVPGELLREQNTVEVFEQYGSRRPKSLKTCKKAILK